MATKIEKEVETATRKRNVAKSTIDQMITEADKIPNLTKIEVQVELEELEEAANLFEEQQSKIEEKCKADDVETVQAERTEFKKKLKQIKAQLRTRLNDLVPVPATPAPLTAASSTDVQLPKLSLPEFDGKYTDWPSFIDLFTATVDRKTSLTDVQKFWYLKGTLRGEAQRLIQSLATVGENYAEAMKLLKDRYENSKLIILTHVKN